MIHGKAWAAGAGALVTLLGVPACGSHPEPGTSAGAGAASSQLPGMECRMTPIPPPDETAAAIEDVAGYIADDIRRYGQAELPDGVSREQLASEARAKIDEQLTRLDELVTDGLDVVAGKTESPHTTSFFLKPCVLGK